MTQNEYYSQRIKELDEEMAREEVEFEEEFARAKKKRMTLAVQGAVLLAFFLLFLPSLSLKLEPLWFYILLETVLFVGFTSLFAFAWHWTNRIKRQILFHRLNVNRIIKLQSSLYLPKLAVKPPNSFVGSSQNVRY